MLTELERIIEYRRRARRLDPVDVHSIPTPIVRLTVADHPVIAPPPELADSVVWLEQRADWTFQRGGGADVDDYLAWRSTWETSHSLGSIASLRDLAAAIRLYGVDADADPDAVVTLERLVDDPGTRGDNRLGTSQLRAFRRMLGDFAAAVRASGAVGVALVESSPTVNRSGLLRVWPSNPVPGEVASRGTVTLRFSGTRLGVWYADDRQPISDVRSFELGADGAVVVDADGTVHLLDDDATDALCAVAPDTTAWRVRQVPEILAWADLLAALETVTDAVQASGATPRIHVGDELHVALTHAD